MFVSVICELAGKDKSDDITELMLQYGFDKVMNGVFETITLSERNLSRLKRDLDRSLDIYDTVRIYQYPMEKTLVISYLEAHKWKRLVLHDSNYIPDLLTAPESNNESNSERKLVFVQLNL